MNVCATCRHFQEAIPVGVGQCRRQPPVPMLLGHRQGLAGGVEPVIQGAFPSVTVETWCSDWEGQIASIASAGMSYGLEIPDDDR